MDKLEKYKLITIIENRIKDEHRKHKDLSWELIAATKIVSTIEQLGYKLNNENNMKQVEVFEKLLDNIFNDGNVTKAQILDAYNKTNQNSQNEMVVNENINKVIDSDSEEMVIYTRPMTDEERKNNIGKPLKMPARYHLVDCLKDLKFGRPCSNQELLDRFIDELNTELDSGIPFK